MGELQWRPPTVNRIAWILHHPIYTGAYVYGLHRQGVKNPVTGRTQGSMWFVPPDEAMVLLKDRHPAYITWERYLANQERLKQNRSLTDAKGAPKCGVALLQGIVVCGKCGRRMSVLEMSI
jgi:hypothetical protein